MTRRKLKIPKLPNILKQKTFKVHKKKGKYPLAPLVKLHTNAFEDQ
jgi:hypothetical protein